MKKCISCILAIALILSAAALAEVPKLSENMFKYAKNALAALADGAYDKLVTSLPFSLSLPAAMNGRNWPRAPSPVCPAPNRRISMRWLTGRAAHGSSPCPSLIPHPPMLKYWC